MIDRQSAREGGYTCLLGEALPTISASTAVFANAPINTRAVRFTLRGFPVAYRTDGSPATTTAGNDLPIGTYEEAVSQDEAKKYRMIQNGGTTTGYIEYLGIP